MRPELTAKQVQQYKTHSEATTMVHMHAQQSNLRSTKTLKTAFNITLIQPQTHLITDDTPPPKYADILQKQPSQSSSPLLK